MPTDSKRRRREHERDPYVKQARQSDLRSRASFKLREVDEKDKLLKPGQTVVDLGATPGSWSQYAAQKVGAKGKVIAVDILPMEPLRNVQFIQGDFTDVSVYNRCVEALAGERADLVISDLSPNLTGIRITDQARSMHMAELVLQFACQTLKPNGTLLIKVFEGADMEQYRRELVQRFQQVMARKPKASRDASREFYILARGYKV